MIESKQASEPNNSQDLSVSWLESSEKIQSINRTGSTGNASFMINKQISCCFIRQDSLVEQQLMFAASFWLRVGSCKKANSQNYRLFAIDQCFKSDFISSTIRCFAFPLKKSDKNLLFMPAFEKRLEVRI